jgi:hypothetical protein
MRLRPRPSEQAAMLARLRVVFGDNSCGALLGVPVSTFRFWCRKGRVRPAGAVRAVWLIYALTLRPDLCSTLFDVATWGRFKLERGAAPGPWSGWSI